MPVQVQQECEATGFLAITGHGISLCQLEQLFAASRKLFDLPLEVKLQLVVKDMKAGRGYEISPEHKTYMQMCKRQLVPPGRNNKHIDSGHFVCRCGILVPNALQLSTDPGFAVGGVFGAASNDGLDGGGRPFIMRHHCIDTCSTVQHIPYTHAALSSTYRKGPAGILLYT